MNIESPQVPKRTSQTLLLNVPVNETIKNTYIICNTKHALNTLNNLYQLQEIVVYLWVFERGQTDKPNA